MPPRAIVSPSNYKEMDDWLNSLSFRQWTGVLGAYATGGIADVISHIKNTFKEETSNWRESDLAHYWNDRNLRDFKGRSERSVL